MVQPSLKREGFSEIPDVKWEDVGGVDLLRQEFERHIIKRLKYSKKYEVILNTKLLYAVSVKLKSSHKSSSLGKIKYHLVFLYPLHHSVEFFFYVIK